MIEKLETATFVISSIPIYFLFMEISAITTMSQQDGRIDGYGQEHELVLPGFRFHPTEEEIIEFYLRRKVEGKRFNVELITLLDLYRYDPWELPAKAAIGEKEWYFYVPRDKKYRNGDRPNRVTTSGYWKATGADRTIKSEDFRSIGLKKTLVFYSGRAPKGVRTSWIMNEYRLPLHETERLQKAEISICRVYKRPGVQDHPSLPTRTSTPSSSSRSASRKNMDTSILHAAMEKQLQDFTSNTHQLEDIVSETSGICSIDVGSSSLVISPHEPYNPSLTPSEQACSIGSDCSTNIEFSRVHSVPYQTVCHDLNRLVNYQQYASDIERNQQFLYAQPQSQSQPQHPVLVNMFPPGAFQAAIAAERWWEWNNVSDPSKEFNFQITKY